MTPSAQSPSPPLALLMLIALGGTMALHILVPALPQAGLSLAATSVQMQKTVSIYALGLAIGQLFLGPLSDSYGRRRVLLSGLALYVVGSLGAYLAQSLDELLLARLVQALGSCAGLVIGRAIVRDSIKGDAAVSKLALLNLAMVISPGLSPLAGGFLTDQWGWRSIFITLICIGSVTFILSWMMLHETRGASPSFDLRRALDEYGFLLKSSKFMGLALATSGPMSIYAMVAAAPFIFMGEFHQTAAMTGLYTGVMILGTGCGYAFMALMAGRFPVVRFALVGQIMCLGSICGLLLLTGLGSLGIWSLVFGVMIFQCGTALIYPVLLARALVVRPMIAGSAAGLFGFLQMSIGAIYSVVVGAGTNPIWSALGVMFCATILGGAGFMVALKHTQK